ELLTGRPPFAGTSLAAIARAVTHDLPAPPSRSNNQVELDLEAICLKCLEKDPARRYPSASDLEEDLERYLSGQPVRARRWSRRERTFRWIAHNRTIFTLAILVFLSLTAGLVVAIFQSQSLRQLYEVSEQHRELAESNFTASQRQQLRAERHLARAEAAIDALLNDVADALEPMPQMESLRRQLLESALEHERGMLAEEEGSLDNRLRFAHSLGRMADLQMRLGMFAEAQETAHSLEQLQDHFMSADGEQRVAGLELVAKAQLLVYAAALERGEIRHTSQQIQHLLDQLAQWNEAEQHPSLMRLQASAWSLRAMAAKLLGQFEETQAASRAAISVLERIPADHRRSSDELDVLANRNQIANVYSDTGNNLLAIDIWRATLERELDLARQVPYQSVVRANHTITRINLASALAAEKDFEESNKHYRQAIEELANWCDQFPLHFRYFQIRLAALTGFGSSLQNQGDIDGAIAIGREATAWGQEVIDRFGDDPRALASFSAACGNLGNLLFYYRQDADAAEGLWEKQLRCARRLVELQPDSAQRYADLAFAFGNLAGFQLASNRLEDAEVNIRESLQAIDQAHQRSPSSTSIIVKYRRNLSNLMLLKCLQRDVAGALEVSQRIISFNPADVEGLLLAASTAARCQQAVVQNTHDFFGQTDDQEMADRYATCCLEFLAAAKSHGFDNVSALTYRPEFSLIITRPEFAELCK
ncbi:MAG TPA: hypothetical protein PKD54_01895, partial [Pirellulaceae bacterium]|nr:hypothetical protein [Pirellulaceae bacterium]